MGQQPGSEIAEAQPQTVAVAGRRVRFGLTNRLLPHIAGSKFHSRFCDKGRYQPRMESIPVKLITHPQPGLFGAAAAFAREHT